MLMIMTTKQHSTNVQLQRQRARNAGKKQRMNNNGAAEKHGRSMMEDNDSCLDRMTA